MKFNNVINRGAIKTGKQRKYTTWPDFVRSLFHGFVERTTLSVVPYLNTKFHHG